MTFAGMSFVADGHALIDMDACANPHIVSDFDRLCVAGAVDAFPCICRMIGCVNTDSGAKQNVVTDINAPAV